MKVKVEISKEIVIDVEDYGTIASLDKYYRQLPNGFPHLLIKEAIAEVEKLTGIPFGDDNAPETIYGVYAEDGEAILEW